MPFFFTSSSIALSIRFCAHLLNFLLSKIVTGRATAAEKMMTNIVRIASFMTVSTFVLRLYKPSNTLQQPLVGYQTRQNYSQ